MPVHSFELEAGTVQIKTDADRAKLLTFCRLAQRINPKRPFLFVSTILGRHMPVAPKFMQMAYASLAKNIDLSNSKNILVCGMAETAVGLGAGVARELARVSSNVKYLSSTRHPHNNVPIMAEFSEDHSHATQHSLHYFNGQPGALNNIDTLVLVDDEATTGNTFKNLYQALIKSELKQIKQVYLVMLTDWSGGAAEQKIAELGVNCTSVSILQGQWSFKADPDFNAKPLPAERWPAKSKAPLLDYQSCRYGLNSVQLLADEPAALPKLAHQFNAGDKVHVLGCGEYVWEPFLLAEQLEKAGIEVTFSATTRSPVELNDTMKYKQTFKDNYGLGIYMYAYNLPEKKHTCLICSNTPADSWDQNWLQNTPRSIQVITP
ncbi:phosphoribosyltransferase domain-containing protein [Gayadomonas joobiniege]|uniref:phosphoribosyltransferase domain-containing protein n=1 Tax=Gayadomonas joobiniege TaxID=1234606 RepID=UPI00035E2A60|nr:phosphoribosyltransferase domain-containing protein [Gayadomonas joobiniege]